MDRQQGHQQAATTSAPRRELIESMARHANAVEHLAVEMIDFELQLAIDADSCVSTHIRAIREHGNDLRADLVGMMADAGGVDN